MKFSVVAAMKIRAANNFKLKDVSFVDFDSIDIDETVQSSPEIQEFEADIEVLSNLQLTYEGEPPESYRVLNGMLQDWVEDHKEDLRKVINPKLIPFLKEKYPSADMSDLHEDLDDYIWDEQVDYTPDIDEDKKLINFTVEINIDVESVEDDD
jgi:hypothetical protein